MESKNESPIILQMLKNVKNLIEVSKERKCWSLEELKEIDITEHNVSEIVKQLQAMQPQEPKRFEEIKEEKAEHSDDKKLDESVEIEEMEDVD